MAIIKRFFLEKYKILILIVYYVIVSMWASSFHEKVICQLQAYLF